MNDRVEHFLRKLGGACLLGVGIWVLVDPAGFQEIVAANPLLFTGAYIILAMGAMLFLLGFLGCCGAIRENKCLLLFVHIRDDTCASNASLYSIHADHVIKLIVEKSLHMMLGFLGCCGAIRENKCLLLFFFMLILIIFLAELAAAILAFIFREHLTREYFTKELKEHYQGYNNTDVFTATWNAFMNTFDCCGVSSPEDFEGSRFRLLYPDDLVPEACCKRDIHTRGGAFISKEECLMGNMLFRNNKGCYSAVVDYFEMYIYISGALAIVVLTIELFAMVFAMCLFRGIQ
ncbi:UNVERIFIED_CONTAM: hypothetical protein FKN15_033315 [Acipenser sinensis]